MTPPTPEEVEERYGVNGEGLDGLFAIPETFPQVQKSRLLPTSYGHDYWLRFPSPSSTMNDGVYARVHEPRGVENPPTLIFGHGICVEFDHYRQLLDEVTSLTGHGIRIIRPEAPWHGRRVLPGHYGGEQLLSALPNSMIEFLAAQHLEWATLIDWCKSNSSGPVAIGGSSLGGQTAKAIAVRARDWPDHLQPHALLCVTHSMHIYEAVLDGELSAIWNLGQAMRDKGWHRDTERLWLDRLDPKGMPCMPGERIISVTGSKDTITPEKTAMEQMKYWQVPKENIFSYRRGHFTVPLGMLGDDEPLLKFASVLTSSNAG
jgi:pimeloyl-ACP methyl ester carboxylesterase